MENEDAIPSYPLIVVDEYQDFSLLETSFLALLATKSKVLIAGDDDQALYDFKNASSRYIRELYANDDYENFDLPYCSRCTAVIVDAVNDVVAAAKANGNLEGRLDKPFECYLPGKQTESEEHPKIIYAQCSVQSKKAPYPGRYIAEVIETIPVEVIRESKEGGYPTVLVIGDKPFMPAAYAVAYGLDRATVVRSFYSGRGDLADQFLPPIFAGHAKGVKRYPYDPAKSRALLRRAGLTLPVKIDFWFPTDVTRPYMLDPKRNFGVFAASLARAGFEVVPHSAPWSPDYVRGFVTGKMQLYLVGWNADFPDPESFYGSHFRSFKPQFGFRNSRLFTLLDRADAETNLARRTYLYERASRLVMELLPIVPYVHAKFAVALRRNVTGYVPETSGPLNESFATVAFASS
jgi:hypothetical protein